MNGRRFGRGRAGMAAAGGAVLLAALAASFGAGSSGGGGAAAVMTTKTFSLAITGAEGARYAGRCVLTTAAGAEETLELAGVVPRHEELAGAGLACRIESADPITVEVAHDGNRSRSVTGGGVVTINVR